MARDARSLICLGAFAGAQGVRGEVRIKPFTEDPMDVGAYGTATSQDGARGFDIKPLRVAKGMVVARVEGIGDRDAALALKGTRFYVPRDRLPAVEDGETWYHADLIGLDAVDGDGVQLGTVTAVHDFGAGDLIDIDLADGGAIMVPFTAETVPDVDVAAGRIVVHLPDESDGDDDEDGGEVRDR